MKCLPTYALIRLRLAKVAGLAIGESDASLPLVTLTCHASRKLP